MDHHHGSSSWIILMYQQHDHQHGFLLPHQFLPQQKHSITGVFFMLFNIRTSTSSSSSSSKENTNYQQCSSCYSSTKWNLFFIISDSTSSQTNVILTVLIIIIFQYGISTPSWSIIIMVLHHHTYLGQRKCTLSIFWLLSRIRL